MSKKTAPNTPKKSTDKVQKPETPETEQSTLPEQVEAYKAKWQRALADYQNLERRMGEHQQQLLRLSNAALLQKLLPVLDSLELAASHLNDAGLDLVIKHFHQMLNDEEVTMIEALDKPFDSNLMECVETVEGEANKVMKVVQTGYQYKDHVLRPAKVEVGIATKTDH